MLAATPTLTTPPDKEQLRQAIDRYSRRIGGADLTTVAQGAHISHSHLWAWRQGHTTPTLPLLLRLCASLGMTPLQFLAPTLTADRSLTATRVVPPNLARAWYPHSCHIDGRKTQVLRQRLGTCCWPITAS